MPKQSPISLNGAWTYYVEREDSGTGLMQVPDQIHASTDTVEIPGNWFRSEIGNFSGVVWFRRPFDRGMTPGVQRSFLRFEAVDYIADVWLNDRYLGRHEGFFGAFEFEVGALLEAVGNVVVVRVQASKDPSVYEIWPGREDLEGRVDADMHWQFPREISQVKGALIHFFHRPGWLTRHGQDCGTGGIWGPVSLQTADSVRIEHINVTTRLVARAGVPDGTALLVAQIDVSYDGADGQMADVHCTIRGSSFTGTEEKVEVRQFLKPGANTVTVARTIAEPRLWATWDHGIPNLYALDVKVDIPNASDCSVRHFGIRSFELDADGQWMLNGKRVFARGMRYLSSIWLGDASREMYERDLTEMVTLNINAVRIGSHVEKPEFYELCDKLGILVWQVFPLHYAVSDADEMISRAVPMMREMVRALRHHPSIIAWSMSKEPKMFPLHGKPNNYGRLCEALRIEARRNDPERWAHKGDYDEGTQHFMPGLTTPATTNLRNAVLKPQIVEFGSGAMAPMETLSQILDAEQRWPPDWNRWFYLAADPRWFRRQGIVAEEFESLEEFVEFSQTWTARQVKELAEFLRRKRFRPVASMFLYYWNDPFPCVFGSGVYDFYRNKYKTHEVLANAYSPILVSVDWGSPEFNVGVPKEFRAAELPQFQMWVTNDLHQSFPDCQLSWKLLAGREVITSGAQTQLYMIEADCSRVLIEMDAAQGRPLAPAHYRFDFELRDALGAVLSANHFEFSIV